MSMSKIGVYLLLILLYLGLAKSLSQNELGLFYINNVNEIDKVIEGAPVSVILTDIHSTGFIIKTYYQKWRIVHGYRPPEEIIIRCSRKFAAQNTANIGMSIFRRSSKNYTSNTTPLPPGSIFIDDPAFGRWRMADSGQRVWRFYRAYRGFANLLGWGDWRPTTQFAQKIQVHINQNKAFYGDENQFGINGEITKKGFPEYLSKAKKSDKNIKNLFLEYFRENFYNEINQL